MNNPKTGTKKEKITQTDFAEGVDYYFDQGLMVLTEYYLRKRGYCCGNGCRHCPYEKKEKAISQKKSV